MELAGSRLATRQWAKGRPCHRQSRHEQLVAKRLDQTGSAGVVDSRWGTRHYTNFLDAPANHSQLHKFGRPGSAWRQHNSERLKGGKGHAAADVRRVQACPLPAPSPACLPCIHQSPPSPRLLASIWLSPKIVAKIQFLFHVRRQSLSTYRQPISMTSSPAPCSPLPLGPVPSLPPSRP